MDWFRLKALLDARCFPCPTCGQSILGCRAWDATRQEPYIGVACTPCDQPYRLTEPGQASLF